MYCNFPCESYYVVPPRLPRLMMDLGRMRCDWANALRLSGVTTPTQMTVCNVGHCLIGGCNACRLVALKKIRDVGRKGVLIGQKFTAPCPEDCMPDLLGKEEGSTDTFPALGLTWCVHSQSSSTSAEAPSPRSPGYCHTKLAMDNRAGYISTLTSMKHVFTAAKTQTTCSDKSIPP